MVANARHTNRKPKRKKRIYHRRKVCRFCADTSLVINYKDPKALKYFITERGKIIPRRISGCCAKHQPDIRLGIIFPRSVIKYFSALGSL